MASFYERQKNLFNHLKEAEDQCNFSKSSEAALQDYGIIDKQTYRKVKHQMKQFRGKESIFKRREANIRECLRAKSIPHYVKDPKKWVHYTLSDVTPEQMSDSTNTATALALIRELEEKDSVIKNRVGSSTETDTNVFKKPMFNISATLKIKSENNQNKTFKNGKVIMPEYVVGVTKKKENKKTIIQRDPANNSTLSKITELKLDHLHDDEEE